MSSLVYIGKIPLTAVVPDVVTVLASISASLTASLAPIALNLTAAIECGISLNLEPPDLSIAITMVTDLLVQLNLGLSLSLPMLNFQVAAVLALIAEISPIIADISASLSLSLPMAELLGTAGIQAFSFDGTGASFGNLVNAQLAGGTPDGQTGNTSCLAFILASTASGTWTGMQDFFTLIPPSQPSDSVEYIGGISLGALCGALGAGMLEFNLQLNLLLGQLKAQLQGALTIQGLGAPTFATNISIATDLLASFNAYLSVGGFILPTVAISGIANLIAQLTDLKNALQASISLIANISLALSTAGVLCYSYNGTIADFGPSITAEVGGGWQDGTPNTAPSNALLLVGTAGVTSSLMSTFFGGL